MTTKCTLYRGDTRGRPTEPEKYRTEGLFTKLINHGDPAYITKVGLIDAVRSHVSPQTISEKAFLEASSFLSFSACHNRARYYASCGQPDLLMPCAEYSENRYVFALDISPREQTSEPGVYLLTYDCDYRRVRSNALTDYDQIAADWTKSWGCRLCSSGSQKHRLLLVDVAVYLSLHPDAATCSTALENASRDSEWLVLPADCITHLVGYSARIALSAIWSAKHFLLTTEQPQEPSLGVIQGHIFDGSEDIR